MTNGRYSWVRIPVASCEPSNVSPTATRVVDVGCGAGVGGIALARSGVGAGPVVLADINAEALCFAHVNAELAGVAAEIVETDILNGVDGLFDLIVCNPPYIKDRDARTYRDGGGVHGEQLGAEIVQQSVARLASMPTGGTLLMYTGSAVVDGVDTFFASVRESLQPENLAVFYEELDPDVFSDELECTAYADVERIAAVFLAVGVSGAERQ
jgi:release factor glutamine methyltransferase